jgi:hypothetical protein
MSIITILSCFRTPSAMPASKSTTRNKSRNSTWSSRNSDIDSANTSKHIYVARSSDGAKNALETALAGFQSLRNSTPPIPSKENSISKEDVSSKGSNRDKSGKGTHGTLHVPWAPIQINKLSDPETIRAGGPISSGTISPIMKHKSFNGFESPQQDNYSPRTASPVRQSGSFVQPSAPKQMSLLSRQLNGMSSFSDALNLTEREMTRSGSAPRTTSRRGSAYSTSQTLSGPLEPIGLVDCIPFKSSPQEYLFLKIIKEEMPLTNGDWPPCYQEDEPRSSLVAPSSPGQINVQAAAADALREIASQYAKKAIASGRPYYSSGNKPTSPFSRQ